MNSSILNSPPTVFSGIQPTGNLHLGNYLGSIANWIDLQQDNQCLFGIMDLHSITIPQNPTELKNNILETAIVYLAAGIDPKKSIIFAQSAVKEHAELAWILSTLTPLGWLNRMTQFKDKTKIKGLSQLSEKIKEMLPSENLDSNQIFEMGEVFRMLEEEEIASRANLGLYSYPVLMAADILLYKSSIVPVGEDQKQHLELARDIAGAFNRQFKTEFFKLPEPLILGNCTRVMSLQDGTKKMSKSDESDLSRINLSDSKEEIIKKIKKAKTDSTIGITYDKARPEIYNLLNIFSATTNSINEIRFIENIIKSDRDRYFAEYAERLQLIKEQNTIKKPEELAIKYQNSNTGKFKEDLANALIAMLEPIQKNIAALKNDLDFVKSVLKQGEENAREIAAGNIKRIKEIVGFY
jgi:tryptophanyl-tRNA synthetase